MGNYHFQHYCHNYSLIVKIPIFQDLRYFKSKKTDRGPLPEEWPKTVTPIMCSYKVVEASFEVWGMQTKCEDLIQKVNIQQKCILINFAFKKVNFICLKIDLTKAFTKREPVVCFVPTNVFINVTFTRRSNSTCVELFVCVSTALTWISARPSLK